MNNFYSKKTTSSRMKTNLVVKYFAAWSKIMSNERKIGYLDLFSGPEKYEDGEYSTPVLIAKHIIEDPILSKKVVLNFNDSNKEFINSLKKNISSLEEIENLRYPPNFSNFTLNENFYKEFSNINIIPTLTFMDPWGYKGLTLELIKALNKDRGCESIIFFNFNRINAGLNNPLVKSYMEDLFGSERLKDILLTLNISNPIEREKIIIDQFSSAIKQLGIKFVLPFRFHSKKENRTSHYIIFISKHPLGYSIMKDIMARESRDPISNIGTFEYIPSNSTLNFLHQFEYNIEKLKNFLVEKYSCQPKIRVKTIYWDNIENNPYVISDFKRALLLLEEENKIIVRTEKKKRPKGSMAEHLWITFL